MIADIHAQVKSGNLTFKDLAQKHLDNIEEKEPRVNAFISVSGDTALERAERLDQRLKQGKPLGPLAGIPVAVKDNLCTLDIKTSCGSKMLENFVPPYNATVVEKLLAADAVIIGKANLDEFAMGSSTETSWFGPTRNPHDIERIPGGSSGGSAAAVAAEEAVIALGSDTGGSIRQPASHCGVVGLKPTYGRVSRYGLVAFASSLDQIGPIATCVEDAAALLSVVAGQDDKDSTSVPKAVPDYMTSLGKNIEGLKIGVPKEYFGEGLRPEISNAIQDIIKGLEKKGATAIEVSLPHTQYAVAAYYIICTAEASSNLARYDGVKYGYRTEKAKTLTELYEKTRMEGFGKEVKRRIMLGTYVLSSGYYDAYYLKASKARTLIKRDFEEAFLQCDLIAAPVSPMPPFKIGEMVDDPLQMYLSDLYTLSVNLAGLPGISVPAGKVDALPMGVQIIGKEFDEPTLLNAAWHVEALVNNGTGPQA